MQIFLLSGTGRLDIIEMKKYIFVRYLIWHPFFSIYLKNLHFQMFAKLLKPTGYCGRRLKGKSLGRNISLFSEMETFFR
jgi:hypothetical protein